MAKPKVTKKEAEEIKMVEITVTEEYLASNPELRENGIEVGDLIEVSEAEAQASEEVTKETPAKKAKAMKGAMAVLKNGTQYIRTYGADQADALAEFLSKDSAYSAVPDEDVVSLEVKYEVKGKDGSRNHTSKTFTDKEEAIAFSNEQRSSCTVVKSK